MNRRVWIFLACIALSGVAFAQTTTVNWFNNSGTLLLDINGVALSQGAANTNTDGMLIQLGYFSTGTTASNFSGNWVALTGATSVGETTIGDSNNLTGLGNGVFGFNTFFTLGSSAVNVYDPGIDQGWYVTTSSVPISSVTPPNGQVLAIRFYDTHSGTSGNYNTVSADTWLWQTPTNAGPSVTIDLANSTLEWQDPNNAFRTSIAATAVPEPGTVALLTAAALFLRTAKRVRRRN